MATLIPGRLLYLAHCHVGSRSTEAALRERGGTMLRWSSRYVQDKHATRAQIAEHHELGDVPSICVVRDPWDMIVSWWWHRGEPGRTLEEFIRGHLIATIKAWHGSLFWHLEAADYVLRWERLELELAELLPSLGVPPLALPRLGVSRGRPTAAEAFEPAARALVLEHFGDDFEAAGYDR